MSLMKFSRSILELFISVLNKTNLMSLWWNLMHRKGVENNHCKLVYDWFEIFLNAHLVISAVNVKVIKSPIRIILLLNLMFLFFVCLMSKQWFYYIHVKNTILLSNLMEKLHVLFVNFVFYFVQIFSNEFHRIK